MGLIPFTKGTPDSPKPEPVLGLTPEGKQRVERFDGSGPMFLVLAYIHENGACSLSALSRGTGMERDKVKVICRRLMAEGLIRTADVG